MTESGKRVYRSDLRAEQARTTRSQVVTAASRLFSERGYAATTIDAVAAEAGVSRKTVFTAVGGKVELMKLAYDWAIAGDDEPLAKVERQEILELKAEPDAVVVIGKYVDLLEESLTRVAPVHDALRSAADVDDQARELLVTHGSRNGCAAWACSPPTSRAAVRSGTVSRAKRLPTCSGSTSSRCTGTSSCSNAAGRGRRTAPGCAPPWSSICWVAPDFCRDVAVR